MSHELLVLAAEIITIGVILLQVVQFLLYVLQFSFAGLAMRERPPYVGASLLWQRYSEIAPPISVIVPAYNEGLVIVESVEALLRLEYPAFEIVVVNDGSTDDTLQRLIERFELKPVQRFCERVAPHKPIRNFHASPRVPRLLVVDKVSGGGKADAVNAGINASRSPIICVTDADTLIEPDAMLRAVALFIDDPEATIGVGGTVRIANGSRVVAGRVVEARLPRSFLALVQTVEYLRAFTMARIGLSRMHALTIISGAFGLFRRDAVMAVGGYSLGTVGEDMELVIKLHRHFRRSGKRYSIRFVPRPLVWTEAPENLGDLGRQRARWQRGSIEVFRKHLSMVLNPRYGAVGLIGFGQVLAVDIVGSLVVVLGYLTVPLFWMLGLLSPDHFLAFIAAVFSLGVLVSVVTLIMDEVLLGRIPKIGDLVRLSAVAVLENFGYRQLCNIWRVRGWYQYLRKKEAWGLMTRKGFGET